MRQCLTYGTLPTKALFKKAFNEECPKGVYEVRNCRELDAVYDGGNVDFDCDGLWDFLKEARKSFNTNSGQAELDGWPHHDATDLASSILYTLGFEWI